MLPTIACVAIELECPGAERVFAGIDHPLIVVVPFTIKHLPIMLCEVILFIRGNLQAVEVIPQLFCIGFWRTRLGRVRVRVGTPWLTQAATTRSIIG